MLPVWQFGGHSSGFFFQLQVPSHKVFKIQCYFYCQDKEEGAKTSYVLDTLQAADQRAGNILSDCSYDEQHLHIIITKCF